MLPESATWLEVLCALIGIAGLGFCGWAVVDDIEDLQIVKREGAPDGPRWLSARGNLGLNAAHFCAWGGYTVIALVAVHLPSNESQGISWSILTAWARLEMGAAFLTGLVLVRITRTLLRRLPREKWAAFFGEAYTWRQNYLVSQADLHEARAQIRRYEAEIAEQRAAKHDALNVAARSDLRLQQLRRWVSQQGISVPDFGLPDAPDA